MPPDCCDADDLDDEDDLERVLVLFEDRPLPDLLFEPEREDVLLVDLVCGIAIQFFDSVDKIKFVCHTFDGTQMICCRAISSRTC